MASISQLAEMTGFDRMTISKRLEHMKHEPGNKRAKLYETRDALPILYKFGAVDSERLDPQQEKAMLDRERRLIVELDRQVKEGKLVDIDQVENGWISVVSVIKGRFLAFPSRIAPELLDISDMRRIEDLLRSEVTYILEEIADAKPAVSSAEE